VGKGGGEEVLYVRSVGEEGRTIWCFGVTVNAGSVGR
jgi:hypothetical protein